MYGSTKARDCVYLDSRSGTEERALGSARLCNKVKLYTINKVFSDHLLFLNAMIKVSVSNIKLYSLKVCQGDEKSQWANKRYVGHNCSKGTQQINCLISFKDIYSS